MVPSTRIRRNVGLIPVRTLKDLLIVAKMSREQDMGTYIGVCRSDFTRDLIE
jgi:hypothetical protein